MSASTTSKEDKEGKLSKVNSRLEKATAQPRPLSHELLTQAPR